MRFLKVFFISLFISLFIGALFTGALFTGALVACDTPANSVEAVVDQAAERAAPAKGEHWTYRCDNPFVYQDGSPYHVVDDVRDGWVLWHYDWQERGKQAHAIEEFTAFKCRIPFEFRTPATSVE